MRTDAPRNSSVFASDSSITVGMPPDAPDAALHGAARGDEGSLTALFRILHPPLLRYLRHHVGPAAEDVASDVWLALAPQLRGFDGTFADLRALMFTVARRRVIDHYRRRARRPSSVPLDESCECAGAEETETLVLDDLTAQGAVEALVHTLPVEQAEIVLLRVLGELEIEQIAEIVGKSTGAVRVAQHRALQRLQRTF